MEKDYSYLIEGRKKPAPKPRKKSEVDILLEQIDELNEKVAKIKESEQPGQDPTRIVVPHPQIPQFPNFQQPQYPQPVQNAPQYPQPSIPNNYPPFPSIGAQIENAGKSVREGFQSIPRLNLPTQNPQDPELDKKLSRFKRWGLIISLAGVLTYLGYRVIMVILK